MIVLFKHDSLLARGRTSVSRPNRSVRLRSAILVSSTVALKEALGDPLAVAQIRSLPEGRDFKRSSMGDMSCLLPRFRHDDKESIYVLRRIEEMGSDANFTLTQGYHEPLVSQSLV